MLAAALAFCLLLVCSAIANTTERAQPANTPDALADWLDDYLNDAIEARRASGIAAVIVRDGEVILERGYGFADAEEHIPVDPAETLFSIGSVSKNFTATAIAQLVERGAIDSFDEPANRYLDRFAFEDVGGQPVTILHMLTHRSGLADSIYGLATRREVVAPIAAEDIAARVPAQVRPSGEAVIYSNAAFGLLGMMLEDVSGRTLPEYFEENIFEPLGMDRSFVRTSPEIPQGYADPGLYAQNGARETIPQDWAYHPFIAPSAGVVSTAHDLARFAQAHLDAEAGLVPDFLGADMARYMHSRLAANHPAVSGFGLSFVVHERHGVHVFENGGSGPGFQATMIMISDRRLALVVMIAGGRAGDDDAAAGTLDMFEVREAFLRRVLGQEDPAIDNDANASEIDRYAGTFRSQRRPHDTVESILDPGLFIEVSAGPEGTLTINGQPGYRQIEPHVFWKDDVTPAATHAGTSDLYAFLVDDSGAVTGVVPRLSIDIFERTNLPVSTIVLIGSILLSVAVLGLGSIFWREDSNPSRWSSRLSFLLGLFSLALLVTVAIPILTGADLVMQIANGNVTLFVILLAIANLMTVLAIALSGAVIFAWLERFRGSVRQSLLGQIHHSIVAIAGISLLPILNYFSLIGVHLP